MSQSPLARRTVLRSLAGAGVLALGLTACAAEGDDPADPASPAAPTTAPAGDAPAQPPAPAHGRRLGGEWEKHERTFMAWPASEHVWAEQLGAVRKDIATVARAVGEREPAVLLVRPGQESSARNACGSDVELLSVPVDDLWARDTVPVFVEEGGKVKGVDFNFSGWGGKQEHTNDARIARAVLQKYGIERLETPITAEGGSFETDGQGTLMVTESSVVNDNRNLGRSRDQVEAELRKALGVTKVIWLAGVKGKDITDAHVDCLARFVAPGVVFLDRAFPGTPPDVWSRSADQARAVLAEATDATGRKLKVIEVDQPDPDRITGRGDAFVSSYMNFYIGDKGVYLPKFGDARADGHAQELFGDQFPGREVVPLQIDTIASGGGGIHCSTHDQPAG
ncbi:porphyromonas-type peptidyl-arginine deiminase [Kitasatospora xanthocidica]|uniref:agmatine deiminase family protein n=1 Tax=Kitasatospora xanthocidica TaxID=83382 RepID=UPI00198A9768|nr:agmatine deiminase family protein [Kitasatospora xanthocidica]GHF89645.1 porphyromonas-type peptidyl-arginine deiminase [Kitasatospora xanthocidica]